MSEYPEGQDPRDYTETAEALSAEVRNNASSLINYFGEELI